MTNPRLLVCNGSPASGIGRRGRAWSLVEPQFLWTYPTPANVNLQITDLTDLTDQMARKLSGVVEDLVELVALVELAALVYAADQACPRTGELTVRYGERWRRAFRFEVAVRE